MMAFLRIVRIQIALVLLLHTVAASKKNHDQQQGGGIKLDVQVNGPLLLNELLLDYDSFARPGANSDGPYRVRVKLQSSFAEWKDDQLKVAFELEQSWTDERLKFTADKELRLSDSGARIWLPDTSFNSLDSRPINPGLITIYPTGQTRWTQQVLLSLPCPLEPSEVWTNDGLVNCTLTLSSRGHSAQELEYAWDPQLTVGDFRNAGSQLRKLDFHVHGVGTEKPTVDAFNETMANRTVLEAPNVQPSSPELRVVFTVQTDFTKSVLRYLTRKAMRDL